MQFSNTFQQSIVLCHPHTSAKYSTTMVNKYLRAHRLPYSNHNNYCDCLITQSQQAYGLQCSSDVDPAQLCPLDSRGMLAHQIVQVHKQSLRLDPSSITYCHTVPCQLLEPFHYFYDCHTVSCCLAARANVLQPSHFSHLILHIFLQPICSCSG